MFPQGTVHAQADEYYTVSDDVYYGMRGDGIYRAEYHYWTLDADQNDIIKMFARGFDGVQLQLVLYLPSGEQIGP